MAPPDEHQPSTRRRLGRPRLRPGAPILRRPGAVQIGLDVSDAVVLRPAAPGLAAWLELLDGSRGPVELGRGAQRVGLTPTEAFGIVDRLVDAGLVDPDPVGPSPADSDPVGPDPADTDQVDASTVGRVRRRGRIRLVGAGRTGRAIAEILAGSDVALLELVDDDPVDHLLYPRGLAYGRQCAALDSELSAHRLEQRSGPRIETGPTWSVIAGAPGTGAGRGNDPDITIVATDRLEADRVVTDTLLRDDQPHLIVRGGGEGVVVGPLVLPGRTACVRCTDLVRRERDPDWPMLLSQLARASGRRSGPLLAWAAGTAVTQVLAALDALAGGPWPESAGTTIEMNRDYRTTRRTWPRHPGCGCGWTAGALLAS